MEVVLRQLALEQALGLGDILCHDFMIVYFFSNHPEQDVGLVFILFLHLSKQLRQQLGVLHPRESLEVARVISHVVV